MSDQVDWQISSSLSGHWNDILVAINQLGGLEISPKGDPFHFEASTADHVTFDFPCLTIALPEKAGSSSDLYLACRGRMTFDKMHFAATQQLRTVHYATESGYFRVKGDFESLKHVYGAHYDLERTRLGHPRFHAQMKPFIEEFGAAVISHIGVELDIHNGIPGVLSTVRTPCAQMDVFSVILQAIADRLMGPQPSQLESDAFENLIALSKNILGCGYMIPTMATVAAASCYRAPHWY